MALTYTLEAHDSITAARAGRLRTLHGEVLTPAFMPGGTQAAVKTLTPDEVAGTGADILLANTYHLHLRPGATVVPELGGLHPVMGGTGGIRAPALLRPAGWVAVRRVRARGAVGGREPQALAGDGRARLRRLSGGQAPLPDGRRAPGRRDRGGGARRRHVRLRAPDPQRAARDRVRLDRPAGGQERRLCERPAAARRRL